MKKNKELGYSPTPLFFTWLKRSQSHGFSNVRDISDTFGHLFSNDSTSPTSIFRKTYDSDTGQSSMVMFKACDVGVLYITDSRSKLWSLENAWYSKSTFA